MKTKLLRKVRKRYRIEWMPNGFTQYNNEWPSCYYVRAGFFYSRPFFSKYSGSDKGAYKDAIDYILNLVRNKYPKLGSYRKKFTKQQIWP